MSSLPPDPRPWLDAAVLARLREEAPPSPPIGSIDELREHAQADPVAQAWLEALDTEIRRADRVRRALQFDRSSVNLPDGSSLTLDQAERALARKEERANYPPLRKILDDLRRETLRFDNHRIKDRDGLDAACGEFLAGTLGARDAARALLATIGHEALDTPFSLARALDLPGPTGLFAEKPALALASAARDAAKNARVAVRRTLVPRRLIGLVAKKAEGVLFGTSTVVLRSNMHLRTVGSAARAVLLAQSDTTVRSISPHEALALGLLAEPVSREVLAASKSDAEAAARIAAAVGLLEARAAASLYRVRASADGPSEDAAREALTVAWGSDAGRVELWERADALEADDVGARLVAAAGAITLRDACDEAFALRPEAWRLALELPAASGAEAARAWTQWVLERA